SLSGRAPFAARRLPRSAQQPHSVVRAAEQPLTDPHTFVTPREPIGPLVARWTIRTNLPISIVHASRSKQARAEPVAALYEQRRVTPPSASPDRHDQLVTWEPLSADPSPDRLDALVWALTDLMLGAPEPSFAMPIFHGVARTIPGQRDDSETASVRRYRPGSPSSRSRTQLCPRHSAARVLRRRIEDQRPIPA